MGQARYVPFSHGKYEVAAGLKPLGMDFGNGEADRRLFQIDEQYERYQAVRAAGRAERLEKYYPPVDGADAPVVERIARWMSERLAQEYPAREWPQAEGAGYRDALDVVASQVQEDVAILRRDPEDPTCEWLAAIHLFFPNHWAAEDKIRKPFNAVHAPVAGFEKLAKAKNGLIDMIVTKGPFVRFAWGVSTDRELNHHPRNEFQGRAFDPARPELYARVERQTLTAFPELHASLFTIRTYFLDARADLSPEERAALGAALAGMTPEQLEYKGLTRSRESILRWLREIDSCLP